MCSMPIANNVKQVMRIAMVGIRPADQVILKGYLRILLSPVVTFDWVSANHDTIDLLMVNQEFKEADSIKRLLSNHGQMSALYIARSATEQGGLNYNHLTLPLKDLEPLNQWLLSHIGCLITDANATAPVVTKAQIPADILAQPMAEPTLFAKTQAALTSRPVETHQHAAAPVFTTGTSTNALLGVDDQASNAHRAGMSLPPEQLAAFVAMVMRLRQRENSLLRLETHQGQHLADIQPKRQRIWVFANHIDLSQGLRLVPSTVTAPPVQASQDLVQWLWRFGMGQTTKLDSLLLPTQTYHLTGWIKPDMGSDQHGQLKIQTILEKHTVDLPTLTRLSDCPLGLVKATLIGLLSAGMLPETIYQAIYQHLCDLVNAPLISEPVTSAVTNTHKTHTLSTHARPSQASDSHLPSQIAHAAQPAATWATPDQADPATMPSPIPTPTQPSQPSDSGMKGFLSRLRRKLGL